MPWSSDADVDRHNAGLSPKQKRTWRAIANKHLLETGDEAAAIRIANAAVKESEDMSQVIESLVKHVQEGSKILHMDASHDALRSSLQRHLATQHRVDNPDSGYYDYPMVHDVYGDNDSGQLVHSKGGVLTRSDFKKDGDGYKLSKSTPVKKSYVAESLLTQESEVQESLGVQEAALDANGRGEICLIKPCRGSMGYYTAEALQRTADKKVFSKDTKMFIDHQTAEERKQRPEGSVFKQAAVLEADASWKNGKDGWGLYAPIKAYSDYVPFINERAKDIGISVRGNIVPTGNVIEGVPEVKEFASAVSVDFVTRAGAGGKLITVYESYREGAKTKQDGTKQDNREQPGSQKEGIIDMEVKESDFKALQDQAALVPKLVTRLDRVEEQNRRYEVRDIVTRLVRESKLPERAQARIAKPFLSTTYQPPMTVKESTKETFFDIPALEKEVTEAIKDETIYLHESGVLRMTPVTKMGGDGTEKQPTETDILAEAETILQESARNLGGLPAVKKAS